jgi:hypothetical protein
MSKQKGSLRVFKHPKLPERDSLSGADARTSRTMKKRMLSDGSEMRRKPSDRTPWFVGWSEENDVCFAEGATR